MEELKITKKDITDLETFANDIPTKYGLPLLNWCKIVKDKNDSTGKSKK